MSTTTQPQTLTVLVLDVDGTLREQDVPVPDGDPQTLAIPRAAMGHGATMAEAIGELFDMTVYDDEDGKLKVLAPNPLATIAIHMACGLNRDDHLVGRIVFVAYDEDGRQVSTSEQQRKLLTSVIDGARFHHLMMGCPDLVVIG